MRYTLDVFRASNGAEVPQLACAAVASSIIARMAQIFRSPEYVVCITDTHTNKVAILWGEW